MRIYAHVKTIYALAIQFIGQYVGRMTWESKDLDGWMERIGKMRGKDRISEREAQELLGWTRESLRKRLSGEQPVPRYIELACRMIEFMERARAD